MNENEKPINGKENEKKSTDNENGIEYPYPQQEIDFSSITSERIAELIEEEDSSASANDWDELFTNPNYLSDEEKTRLRIESDIERMLIQYGYTSTDNDEKLLVKEKLNEYLGKLSDEKEKLYAKNYIKKMIRVFMEDLKEQIVEGKFIPTENNYHNFLSKLRLSITLRFPFDADLYRFFIFECFAMYNDIKTKKSIPTEQLRALNSYFTVIIGGAKLKYELSEDLKRRLKVLSEKKIPEEFEARLPALSGQHSIANFSIIPPLTPFPDINPYKEESLDLLDEIRKKLLDYLLSISSFKLFIKLNNELKDSNYPEADFIEICQNIKTEIDVLYEKIIELEQKLTKLINEAKKNRQKIRSSVLPDYIKRLRKHVKSVWENGIFPALLFFSLIRFGETKNFK